MLKYIEKRTKYEKVDASRLSEQEKAIIRTTLNKKLVGKKLKKGSKRYCKTSNFSYIVIVNEYGSYTPIERKKIP